jgi:hypothetical protein
VGSRPVLTRRAGLVPSASRCSLVGVASGVPTAETRCLRRPKSRRCRSSYVAVFVNQPAEEAGASQ